MEQLICPECEAVVNKSARHCMECGCPMDYIVSNQPKDSCSYSDETVYSASTDISLLFSAAEVGNSNAQYWLAYCYYYGLNGLDDDEDIAEEWLRKAKDAGHSEAINDYTNWFEEEDEADSSDIERCPLDSLFERYDSIVFFDVETSGLNPEEDEIIELSAVKTVKVNGCIKFDSTFNSMIKLAPGKRLSPRITEISGISNEMITRSGQEKDAVGKNFLNFLGRGKALMVAYNAQFDVGFLNCFFSRQGHLDALNDVDYIDAMTVYKDRRSYPHKLKDAISAYGLVDKVANCHRAKNDVEALYEVFIAMDNEYDDLPRYINIFGYNPKYGVNGKRLPKIKYFSQDYYSSKKIYQ